MTSTKMYNTILAGGRHLANIASSDNMETYNKLLMVLRYIRANIQNKYGEEMK